MVIAQIILLSWCSVKKTNQKEPIKMVGSKTTCPKWHFGHVGHGAKKPYEGFLLLKFQFKKVMISCNDCSMKKLQVLTSPYVKAIPKPLQIQTCVFYDYQWRGILSTHKYALCDHHMLTMARWQPSHQFPKHPSNFLKMHHHYTTLVSWFTNSAIFIHHMMHISRKLQVTMHIFQCSLTQEESITIQMHYLVSNSCET